MTCDMWARASSFSGAMEESGFVRVYWEAEKEGSRESILLRGSESGVQLSMHICSGLCTNHI